MSIELSVIIPVYNRPNEVDELLYSLSNQTYKNFEIIIIDDGSTKKCDTVVKKNNFLGKVVKYFYKENSGPGTTRNFGVEKASGNYFIFLDSDCIIPKDYIKNVTYFIEKNKIDCFGGADKVHKSFTVLQKAINYSMTSFLTTGGIRGSKKSIEKFHPRSFNMGFSKKVFEKTKGFSNMRFGEDIDMSIRIMQNDFQTAFIPNIAVYHKRRTSVKQFFKQIINSGIARIDLYQKHPQSLKLVHFFPTCFLLGSLGLLGISFCSYLFLLPLFIYATAIYIEATIKNKNLIVALFSVFTSFVQFSAYGLGFLYAFFSKIIFNKKK